MNFNKLAKRKIIGWISYVMRFPVGLSAPMKSYWANKLINWVNQNDNIFMTL